MGRVIISVGQRPMHGALAKPPHFHFFNETRLKESSSIATRFALQMNTSKYQAMDQCSLETIANARALHSYLMHMFCLSVHGYLAWISSLLITN